MAEIDVIIPSFNRPELTERAVRSVMAQTFTDWKVILVDDGSEPDNATRLERLTDLDPRIAVVRRLDNGGAPEARQTGFEHSTAEWIAILDSDDVWLPTKLERQAAARDDFDIVLCWFAWIALDGTVRVVRRPDGSGMVRPTLTNNQDIPLMRRAVIERSGGFAAPDTPRRFDDHTDFFIRLLTSGTTVIVPEVLVHCMDHLAPRESTGVPLQAESLASVVRAREPQLRAWPDCRSELAAQVAARYFARHDFRKGASWAFQAIAVGSAGQRCRSLRRCGPYGVKEAIRATAQSLHFTGKGRPEA